MTGGDFLKALRAGARGVLSWAKDLRLFTLAVLFALGGHLLFALLLNALAAFGVDFAALDQSHNLVPGLQILLFAVVTGLVVFALVRSGLDRAKTYIGVGALLWAAAMLMITFVTVQCDLYGECL